MRHLQTADNVLVETLYILTAKTTLCIPSTPILLGLGASKTDSDDRSSVASARIYGLGLLSDVPGIGASRFRCTRQVTLESWSR